MPWKPAHPIRVTVITAAVGLTLIGLLAVLLRRRKPKRAYRDLTAPLSGSSIDKVVSPSGASTSGSHSPMHKANGDVRMRGVLSPVPSFRSSISRRSDSIGRRSDVASVADSNASTVTCTNTQGTSNLTADQLCELGLDSLQIAISHWEDAMEKVEALDEIDQDAGLQDLHTQLHYLLESAYKLREAYEKKLFHQLGASAVLDSAVATLQEMDQEYEIQRRKSKSRSSATAEDSDQDSFVSASEFADLSDLDDYIQRDTFHMFTMYEAALHELKDGNVPCRTIRTKMLECSTDTEFLAKLHCVRQGFDEMFKDETVREWLLESFRDILSKLLEVADRDPIEFQVALEALVEHARNEENWETMEEELKGRGVVTMSFFDTVIDFIILDAFMDLESPPSSVTTVVRNRWLSDGFKETALATACWSVLKAKRRMLRYPNGFIGHFYSMSEHTSPVLAWGFLGPDGPLKDLCNFFKDQILGYIRDVFRFDRVRYTNVQQMAEDMVRLARERQTALAQKLGI